MILVVGPGGSGQSYFMQFINGLLHLEYKDRLIYIKYNPLITNCIINTDKLKHISSPNKIKTSIDKCIYIFGDPHLSIMSHFRMGWAYALGNPYNLEKKALIDYDTYIEIAYKENKDMIGIEWQFDNWSTTKTSFPILFLDFTTILNNTLMIETFLEKKIDFSSFRYRPRTSQKNNDKISIIYDNLYSKMKNISNIKNEMIK
jgi:hypothetical protein